MKAVQGMTESILAYYLKRFEGKDRPASLAGRRGVGMEAKFCLTGPEGEAVDGDSLQAVFAGLEDRGWTPTLDGGLGVLTGAVKDLSPCPAVISTGTGHCKVEFSVPYGGTLRELESNFYDMATDCRACADGKGARFLCLGVHPVTEPSPSLVQRKPRHIFWDRVFETGLVHLFALSADCQVHVDVEPDEVHDAVNVFQGLTGAQIALTANATIWKNAVDPEYLDVREAFWDWWLPGEERAGVVSRPFDSLEDYVDRLASLRPVFVERGGCSLGIYQYDDFRHYYLGGGEAWGITPDGGRIPLEPVEDDIDLHDTFNWYTARFSRYCTLENRANCQQPREDIMAIPALTLGIMENLDDALSCLAEHEWEDLRASRQDAMRRGMEAAVGGRPISELCRDMLAIAEEGLLRRGGGEEKDLAPLWKRLEGMECPAIETRKVFHSGGVEALLERYSL